MADPGVPVQLTAQLMLGQTTGVVPLLWQYLGRRGRPISGYTWQDPGQVGIPNHFPSPASCYNVASGMDVHWLGLWKYTVVFWYVIDFHYPSRPRMLCFVTYLTDDRFEHPVSPLTDFLSFLRNICTLWWRFPKMRFLFWTQIWCCHSRRGHLQECPTWWWSKPQGEYALPWWRGSEADHSATSMSDVALHLTFLMTSNYLEIQVFLLCFISM